MAARLNRFHVSKDSPEGRGAIALLGALTECNVLDDRVSWVETPSGVEISVLCRTARETMAFRNIIFTLVN